MSDATAIERVEDLMDEVVRLMPNEEWLPFAHNSRWLAISDETIDEIVPDIENITKMQKYKILKMWKRRIGMEANGAKLKEIFQNFMQNYEMLQSQGQSQPASQQTEVIQEGAAAQNMAAPRYRIGSGTTREVQPQDVAQPTVAEPAQQEGNVQHDAALPNEGNQAAEAQNRNAAGSFQPRVSMTTGTITAGQFVGYSETNNYPGQA
uniref:uncharacterized protein LOC120326359 isoform X2 n=1 Tax=Styela clava TaxID=7725 RepID=UPI0019398A25|nr:uncharacterized protein LOC120326359 isoform X2 [Styela clava]